MRLAALALAAVLSGCGAVTHPRYAPDLGSRWPECDRVLVIDGTLDTQVKNFRADDWFEGEGRAHENAQDLAQAVRKVLRDRAHREPRIAAEAGLLLDTDAGGLRAIADRMLAHARGFMAHDPAYEREVLGGLGDPGVVPFPLRREFDAIVVVGGRTRYETRREQYRRYTEIVVRNTYVYPLLMASAVFPIALPFSLEFLRRQSYWRDAPNATYLTLAIFDGLSGRLLYSNDWYDSDRIDGPDAWEDVARDLLRPIEDVHADDVTPLGERPEGWRPGVSF